MKQKPVTKPDLAPVVVELAHAMLSASGSKVWLACTPAPRLCAQFPDEDSKFAVEGTLGHSIFEHLVGAYLGRWLRDDSQFKAHALWTQELQDSVESAVAVAIEHIDAARAECPDAVILLEQRLDFSQWVPQGFGTGDLVIVTDRYVKVLDLKMGKGIEVYAQGNSQFRLYGLGAFHAYSHLYDFKTVIGGVLQPRLNNYSTEELTVEELLQWAHDVVVPAAKKAWSGEGEFVAGEHCSSGFCRARHVCAARAEHNLAVAASDFAGVKPELLTDEQITKVLAVAPGAIKWMNEVQAYALEQATKHGRIPAGYKLVEGRSNRKYANQDAVAAALVAAGIPEALIYERSLLGITAMEQALGKKQFNALLSAHVVKPSGAPTLVPVDDKREAINSVAAAISDFS